MLKNRIIPCLDVKNGRVVKGINFTGLKDAGDPAEQAEYYSNNGADEICFLDITASNENRNTIIDIVKKTAEKCFVPLTVGGGIRSIKNIRDLLLAGADKVSINTAAVEDINFVNQASKKFGTQCMVVAVDAKKISENKWEVFTHGGRKKTGIDAIDFSIKSEKNGAGEILLTSMDKDGTKTGYDLELLKLITKSVKIPVIASGGAGTLEHLYEGIKLGGANAVLAASIFHYGEFTIREAKEYLESKEVPVRIKI
jgi:cyclase